MVRPAAHFPAAHASAAIVSQGDELTLGQKLDTNSQFLARQLLDLGITPVEHVTLPDDQPAIAAAFTRLSRSVDLIICTGGLGPTADDLTRFALAEATADQLVPDDIALAQIEAFFLARGRQMNRLNRVQAQRPSRGLMLDNPHGTAPGIFSTLVASSRACDIFCLPGPPREMIPMFEHHVAPRLRPPPGRTVRTRVLHTVGLGESDVAALLKTAPSGDLMDRARNPLVGTTASGGIVSCRLRYEGPLLGPDADARLDDVEHQVRGLIGSHVFGTGDDRLAEVAVRHLRARRQTVAVAESCTGGLLAGAITEIPGASAVFAGGWITYSNALKQQELNVPEQLFKSDRSPAAPGAVSAPVAHAMAVGGLARARADYCLAVTGIAGPDGGTPDKPVGTVYIALAARTSGPSPLVDVRRFSMAGERAAVRAWSVTAALAILWLHLAERPSLKLLRQSDEAAV